MEQLARATGGKQRVDLAGIWDELPKQPRMVELRHWLLVVALTLFLLEVFERRTGMLSTPRRALRKKQDVEQQVKTRPARRRVRRVRLPRRKPAAPETPDKEPPAPTPPPEQEKPGIVDALRHARHRARERTDRHE